MDKASTTKTFEIDGYKIDKHFGKFEEYLIF